MLDQSAFEYAGLGTRLVALLIDSFIVVLVVGACLGITGFSVPDPTGNVLGLVPILTIGAVFLYFTLMESLFGATIGKMLFRVKVVKENGSKCGFNAAFVRNLLRFIDGFFFYVVGVLLVLRSQKRQRLGDRLAKTLVIKPSRTPLTYAPTYPHPSQTIAYSPPPPPPIAPPLTEYCMSCGSLISIQAMFCPRCGGHQ